MLRGSDRVVRFIAAFRFVKALLLFAAALGVLKLLSPGAVADVKRWVEALPLASQQEFVQRLLAKLTRIPQKKIAEGAIVLFLYAALYTTETFGLWFRKRWGEWLTIIATTSFIPFEVYEVVHKATIVRVSVLVLNIAIVIFLLYRRRTLK